MVYTRRMSHVTDELRRAVEARGLSALAKELGVQRATLANYLLGRAQRGSALLIEQAWQKHTEGKSSDDQTG